MDIKEYISSVITQISEAVCECNGEHSQAINDVAVNPVLKNCIHSGDDDYIQINKQYIKITKLDFDIATTTNSSKEGGAKIGVQVLGCGGNATYGNENVSRVKFSMSVIFPSSKIIQEE